MRKVRIVEGTEETVTLVSRVYALEVLYTPSYSVCRERMELPIRASSPEEARRRAIRLLEEAYRVTLLDPRTGEEESALTCCITPQWWG